MQPCCSCCPTLDACNQLARRIHHDGVADPCLKTWVWDGKPGSIVPTLSVPPHSTDPNLKGETLRARILRSRARCTYRGELIFPAFLCRYDASCPETCHGRPRGRFGPKEDKAHTAAGSPWDASRPSWGSALAAKSASLCSTERFASHSLNGMVMRWVSPIVKEPGSPWGP